MSDTSGTPESLPDTETETVEEAAAPVTTPEASAPEEPQLPPKERRAARRAATAAAPAGPKTVEEREALRLERRGPPHGAEPQPVHEHGPGRPKVRQGVVVSDRADKTIVVRVDVAKRHRRYGKIMRTSTKLHAHDATNDAGAGDTVRLIESRPLSATKRWRLVEVVERAR